MQRNALLLAAVLGLSATGSALANGTVEVSNAWARATPPGIDRGAGYLQVHNHGEQPVRLVGATTEVASDVQIHHSREADGQVRMERVDGGIRVPAGESRTLAPMGYHLMLMGLKAPLKAGERFPLTLEFSRHADVDTSMEVRPPEHDSHGMDHTH